MHKFEKSTALEGADYSPATQTLTVTMKGGRTYDYEKVDQKTYDGLIGGESPGKFFQSNIRGKFTHKAR